MANGLFFKDLILVYNYNNNYNFLMIYFLMQRYLLINIVAHKELLTSQFQNSFSWI